MHIYVSSILYVHVYVCLLGQTAASFSTSAAQRAAIAATPTAVVATELAGVTGASKYKTRVTSPFEEYTFEISEKWNGKIWRAFQTNVHTSRSSDHQSTPMYEGSYGVE